MVIHNVRIDGPVYKKAERRATKRSKRKYVSVTTIINEILANNL